MADLGGAKATVAFTADDAITVMRHLQDAPMVVLVGGQALNFWAERFRKEVADIECLAPFLSSDIDFIGSVRDAEACARNLNGRVAYPSADHINTPEVGVVHCVVNDKAVKIDFLGYLAGPTTAEVRKSAVDADVGGIVLRVLHPVNIVKSRLANIFQLRRKDELSLRQMKVSVHVVGAYIRLAIEQDARVGLDLIEALFKMATSDNGLRVWHDYSIDIFSSVDGVEGLPAAFGEKRYPQMKAHLNGARQKHSDLLAKRSARKS
jgi:hypothetical protein